MRVSTITFDPTINSYVFAFFNILIYSGLGVVVWYKTMHGDPMHPPDGFMEESFNPYMDPTSVVEGYKRVSYLFTKDIIQTVIRNFTTGQPFHNIWAVDVFPQELDITARQRVACVGSGIMIAIFIATKVLIPVTTGAYHECW